LTKLQSANTPTAITVNSSDPDSQGVFYVSNSRITFNNQGVYNFQFSAQLHNNGGGGSGQTVNIWLRKNGVNVA